MVLGWDLADLMLVYWCQSAIIGYYNFLRIRLQKRFTTEGFTINGQDVPQTEKGKRSISWFFLLHYGGFHLGFLMAIMDMSSGLTFIDYVFVASAAFSFKLNHAFSFQYHLEKDLQRQSSLGSLFGFPYLRIIPMLAVILAGQKWGVRSCAGMIMFAALKTGADLLMHAIEHARTGSQPEQEEDKLEKN